MPDAVLYGRYINQYDKSLDERIMPSANWLRDDDIGGLRQLSEVFDYLEENNLADEAIKDKELSVKIWKEIREEFSQITISDNELCKFIENSIEYGLRFFTVVDICFIIMAKCRKNENVKELVEKYDKAWEFYKKLETEEQSSSSYNDDYKFDKKGLGFNDTLEYCRENLC